MGIDHQTIAAQRENRQRRIIRVDGRIELVDKPLRMREIEILIRCELTDSVNLRHLGYPPMVMIVDDRSYQTRAERHGGVTHLVPIKALKPVNEIATALYLANCMPGATHKILGDVYVCPDEDFA